MQNMVQFSACNCAHCSSFASQSAEVTRATTVSQEFSVGNSRTDTLLDNFTWTGTTGQSVKLTYSFENTFESSARSAAVSALKAWANVANVSFSSQNSDGDITFAKASFADASQGGIAYTSFVGTTIKDVDVEISNTETNLSDGTFGYTIVMHEIGHALGLKHTGNYGSGDTAPFLPAGEDNFRASLMSYNEDTFVTYDNPPTTPMLYDIAAMQYLYGANTSYKSGNTLYKLTSEKDAKTVWDGGGTDVFSAASYSGAEGVRIDLTSGLENYTKVGNNYLWVAFNADIENAEGSSGNDAVAGNALNNTIYGRAGSDKLFGNDGADTIFGGVGVVDANDGADEIYGGTGDDQLYGNSGNDMMYGGRNVFDPNDGADLMYGGKGADSLYGNAGNDTMFGGGSGFDPNEDADLIYGGKGADVIYGNGNNDVIYGGGSGFDPNDEGDVIYGGVGNDIMFGNGGADSMYGGTGNDTMHGGAANDFYYFDMLSNGVDQISSFEGAGVTGGDKIMIANGLTGSGITNVADALARTLYDGSNAYINFGGGNGVLIIGIGAVTFGADDIVIF